MRTAIVVVLALALALAACKKAERAIKPLPPPTAAQARAFVANANITLRTVWVASQLADWNRETDITAATEAAGARANAAAAKAQTALIRDAHRFDPIRSTLDFDTLRQLDLMRLSAAPAPDNAAHATELAKVTTEMSGLYGKGTVCPGPTADNPAPACRDLEALTEVMAKSRDPAELLAVWTGWHGVGRTIKSRFVRFVELANEGARGIGFADVGEQWRSRYDMPPDAIVAEADRLWTQVRPLYDQLYCYVRRKLSATYGASVVSPTGPMPAHILGNMWAQDWTNIYDLVEPFPGEPSPDVSAALVAQHYDPPRMARLAEGFFTSLGLPALPDTFWQRSMLTKPAGKDVVCHPSAWDPQYSGDVRIKMCVTVNQSDLVKLHHELGHDYYYLNYHTLPVLYQDGANDGFHEAIGDTIALSITPAYLHQVGLLDTVAVNDKAVIDRLMFVALEKIPFLPWSLLVDKWRWEVFAGKVTPAQYTERWWQLREQYEGIVPPVPRTADDFDPGAKYHVPENTPYLRYFLAAILQFQFHRALCQTAGQTGPLYACSIYGSKAAGDRLAHTLALGASRRWPDALESLTGERELDGGAILEYFAPLLTWLTAQNQGQACGW